MWPLAIVILTPDLDDLSRVVGTAEQAPVETLVPTLIDEALGKHLLHRLAWRDVMPFDGEGFASGEDRFLR